MRYSLDELTEIINSSFRQPGGADPVPSIRGVRAVSAEYFTVNYENDAEAALAGGFFIGILPGGNPPNAPFYYGKFTYNAQIVSGATLAGESLYLFARTQAVSSGPAVTDSFTRRKILAAGVPAYTELVNIERSVNVLFQDFSFQSLSAAMVFSHTFTFSGIRINWT
jgi:hypothetical protein